MYLLQQIHLLFWSYCQLIGTGGSLLYTMAPCPLELFSNAWKTKNKDCFKMVSRYRNSGLLLTQNKDCYPEKKSQGKGVGNSILAKLRTCLVGMKRSYNICFNYMKQSEQDRFTTCFKTHVLCFSTSFRVLQAPESWFQTFFVDFRR